MVGTTDRERSSVQTNEEKCSWFAGILYKYRQTRARRWIHLHSVLWLHSNNTTNFIFIINRTNFYHYLGCVCSSFLEKKNGQNVLALYHHTYTLRQYTFRCSSCNCLVRSCPFIVFVMHTGASDCWCIYIFVSIWMWRSWYETDQIKGL